MLFVGGLRLCQELLYICHIVDHQVSFFLELFNFVQDAVHVADVIPGTLNVRNLGAEPLYPSLQV